MKSVIQKIKQNIRKCYEWDPNIKNETTANASSETGSWCHSFPAEVAYTC